MKLTNLLVALLLAAAAAVRADPAFADVTYGATVPSTKIGVSLGLGGGATGFSASEATDQIITLALRAHVICTLILWPANRLQMGLVCVPRPEAVVTAAVHGGMKHHFPLCHQKRRQLRLIQYLSPQTSLRHQKNLL